ncbi:chromosome segregation protein [Coccidioides immitis RS]|uniref:Chromosome segregation protein n=1 Tax=Coccidioides immitis (strain RS) TaxID=246410 RepID=J3K4P4_COCIM|nr:chromosome segregation protein [Coccidioides immitis RS]EAS29299.3 chromosome segregation protein [Coccidioides immitis RS]
MASRGDSRPRSRRSIAPIPQTSIRNGSDKENLATDANAAKQQRTALQTKAAKDKKLRSKSLGPGGLDALKDGHGNRRKSTIPFPLKSILKPAIPVSPIQSIPSFEETRKRTPGRSPQRLSSARGNNAPLIDFSTPPPVPVVGTESLPNPFDTFNPTPALNSGRVLQSEQERQAAKREREARERHEHKQAILEQRAARRKSMANRRVSFAPEATLHTWNVVELMDDSTTSSASTNSTRRASSLTTEYQANPSESPRSLEEENDDLEQFSPAKQQDFLQRSLRRNSGTPHGEFDNVDNDDAFSSSPFSGDSGVEGDDTGIASLAPENEDSLSDSYMDNENTAMSLDNATGRSMMSAHSDGSTTDSSARLDRSLRLAAQIAGSNGIDRDDNEDFSMEYAKHEIAGAFKPWIKKGTNHSEFDAEDLSSRLDQENVNPFRRSSNYPQHHRGVEEEEEEDDDDDANYDETGMDLTKPIGGILSKPHQQSPVGYESNMDRRTSGATTHLGEQTMEFTNVVGGIDRNLSPSRELSGDSDIAEDEEMTMEFTSVFGGVLKKHIAQHENSTVNKEQSPQTEEQGDQSIYPDLTEMDMEMTGAVGGILPPIEEQTEPLEDETIGMEMTNAVGKILPSLRPSKQGDDSDPEPASSPFQENIVPSPAKPSTPLRITSVPFQDESPSLSHIHLKPKRSRSSGARSSTTPTKPISRQTTPVKRMPSPSKSKSPHVIRSTTPATPTTTSPPHKGHLSPKKVSKPDTQQPTLKPGSIFQHGQSTPKIVLQARRRSPSGLGIDKEGLGSPRVADILDRRRSIGEDAQTFTPTIKPSRGVRFNDPHKLEEEAKKEQQHEGQQNTAVTASPRIDRDTGLNIREMISSLTPKKNKLKGRKSLHVGAAKGLLGKRPIELDMEDDDEDNATKRLRARESSPVKNIKLPAPPSKAETVGKVSRLSLRNSTESPAKANGTTPKSQPHCNVADLSVRGNVNSQDLALDREVVDMHANPQSTEFKPLQLSEFLKMTNIHFMELNTTKRRHTIAPDAEKRRITEVDGQVTENISLEDCVAAGFCTIPMLELYQHSCRELKSYISEGRQIIRSIEAETYAENPPLFQEYITAPPDIRLLMDNQFRNVKAHARLLSKSMWYEWRMKLLEGLKQGLDHHVEEMNRDSEALSKKEKLLDDVVPELVNKHARLQVDAHNLEKAVEEMKNCDQEELKQARERLRMIDLEIAQRKEDLNKAQSDLEKTSNIVKKGTEQKAKLLKDIQEAESILEECRGWSVNEVDSLKAVVRNLEKSSGWTIISVSSGSGTKYGPALSMRYSNELRLDFHPAAFTSQQSKDLAMTLSYAPEATRGSITNGPNPTPEIALVLHALRTRISHLTQSVSPKAFLSDISQTWNTISSLRNEIHMLDYCGVTKLKTVEANPGEPALLKVRCILLGFRTEIRRKKRSASMPIVPAGNRSKARIDVDFTIKPRPTAVKGADAEPSIDVDVDIDVYGSKVYGFSNEDASDMSEEQIGEFLMQLIQRQDGRAKQFGRGLWRDAVKELEGKVFS